MRSFITFGSLTALAFTLSACSGDDVKRAFSLQRSMPDEYTVVTRAPLSMPPSEKLVLPGRHTTNLGDNAGTQALETLSPEIALHPVKGEDSPAQRDLAQEALEASARDEGKKSIQAPSGDLTDRLMFWQKPADLVVDEKRENDRLQKVTGLGGKMNDGVTPAHK